MFGVFKRKFKAKKTTLNDIDINSESTFNTSNTNIKSTTIQKIHPIFDPKSIVQNYNLDFDKDIEFYPTKLKSVTLPAVLTPNICVEDGRIEFIKGTSLQDSLSDKNDNEPKPDGQNTGIDHVKDNDLQDCNEKNNSLSKKDLLKSRILELEQELENAQKMSEIDKQTIIKLQKQLTKRESLLRDEEKKSKESTAEAVRYKARLRLLTHEYHRMEDAVRTMISYKNRLEQLKQEKSSLSTSYETRIQHYQNTITTLNDEIEVLKGKLNCQSLLNKSTSSFKFSPENNNTINQYEKCLDDIANQVVKALLTQKTLQQEITVLKAKIIELENQNTILTTLIVQLIYENKSVDINTMTSNSISDVVKDNLDLSPKSDTSSPSTPINRKIDKQHFNSFNSDLLLGTDGKNLSEFCDKDKDSYKLSLDDKKRHQLLTDLWKDLKSSEVTPQKLIEALSKVDPSLWVPPKRPITLNLKFPLKSLIKSNNNCNQFNNTYNSASKSEEETGNESPESGNRDEGYSTMSSDVQCDTSRPCNETSTITNPNKNNSQVTKCLEGLKEVIDESVEFNIENHKLILEDINDPDIFYIPLNFAFGVNSRNSFPPTKSTFPFHYAMRSFSDSHLCLKITKDSSPSPIYSLSSPITSSPSVLLIDSLDKNPSKPLKRTKGADSLITPLKYSSENEILNDNYSDFIHHWLYIDETQTKLLQQHKTLFDIEYDQTELEDWSLSFSSDDVHNCCNKSELVTPGQMSTSTLPSIQENNALELEEDSNECLWNDSSYMNEFRNFDNDKRQQWPYVSTNNDNMFNDRNGNNNEQVENKNKKSLNGAENESESQFIGTDFTRDFYRLVKYESTKSLESMSCRSTAIVTQPTVISNVLNDTSNEKENNCLQNVNSLIDYQQNHSSEGNEILPPNKSSPCTNTIQTSESTLSSIPVLNKSDKFKRKSVTNDNKPIINGETSRIPRRNKTSTPISKPMKNNSKKLNSTSVVVTKMSNEVTKIPKKLTQSNIRKTNESKLPKFAKDETNSDQSHVKVNNNSKTVTADLLNFSETKTSKQLIDQLNEMIHESNESLNSFSNNIHKKLDSDCKPTSWIRLDHEIDLNNPKARANLLDVMLASSDSSPTSSFDDNNDLISDFRQFNNRKSGKESSSAPCTPMTETTV